MNSKLLPILKPINSPDEYPFSRAKMQISGKWYVPKGGDVMMLASQTTLKSGIFVPAFQCQDCKRVFVVDSEQELYHECMGVQSCS